MQQIMQIVRNMTRGYPSRRPAVKTPHVETASLLVDIGAAGKAL